MGIFSLFKKKTEIERLQQKYQALTEASFQLSKTDRVAADEKTAEAEEVANQIESLKKLGSQK